MAGAQEEKIGEIIRGLLCWSRQGLIASWARQQERGWVMRGNEVLDRVWGSCLCLWGANGVDGGVRASQESSRRRGSNSRLRGVAFPSRPVVC